MSLAEIITADIRLVILRLLNEDPDYSMNASVLQRGLDIYGHGVSIDKVRTELRWLQEQDLIRIDEIGDVLVAHITRRGSDVAAGKSRVDGVHKPSPR